MIRILIADDSAFLRQVLKYQLELDPLLTVVASAINGKEAIKLVKEAKPDILILDCIMPVMSGLEALKVIMAESPLPVILFSTLAKEGASVTIQGLELGALDFVTKPNGGGSQVKEVITDLINKIKALYRVRTFRALPAQKRALNLPTIKKRVDVIALASSAGGVQASLEIIPKLPKNCPPVVWVQHMPENFTASFANRLNSLSQIEVKEAQNHDKLRRGLCLLAPGGLQMSVKKMDNDHLVRVFDGDKVSGHKPSCDLLLNSVAIAFKENALGVILTGMGQDGAEGMLHMHNNGAFTIGQDEASCVVYSMPKVAKEIGGIDIELPLTSIINQLMLMI